MSPERYSHGLLLRVRKVDKAFQRFHDKGSEDINAYHHLLNAVAELRRFAYKHKPKEPSK